MTKIARSPNHHMARGLQGNIGSRGASYNPKEAEVPRLQFCGSDPSYVMAWQWPGDGPVMIGRAMVNFTNNFKQRIATFVQPPLVCNGLSVKIGWPIRHPVVDGHETSQVQNGKEHTY